MRTWNMRGMRSNRRGRMEKKEMEMEKIFTSKRMINFMKWEIWCDCRRFGNRWNNIKSESDSSLYPLALPFFPLKLLKELNKFMNEKRIKKISGAKTCVYAIHRETGVFLTQNVWLSVWIWSYLLHSHWFHGWYRAICNRMDQIEILFKTFSLH